MWTVKWESSPGMDSEARGTGFDQKCQSAVSIGLSPNAPQSEGLAKSVLSEMASGGKSGAGTMINLDAIKITPRDEEVLRLLAQGCSNKEIAGHLNISPRTVKQHLRTLFLRAGITEGRKRVKLATAMFAKEQMESCTPAIS
jgi:DNA-binding NarL/FixJ family response regulator